MVHLLGSVSGTVAADHGLFLVLDERADDIGDPDLSQDRICWSGRDALFVASPSNATCRASVTVQAWDGEPAAVDSTTWPDTDSTEVTLDRHRVPVAPARHGPRKRLSASGPSRPLPGTHRRRRPGPDAGVAAIARLRSGRAHRRPRADSDRFLAGLLTAFVRPGDARPKRADNPREPDTGEVHGPQHAPGAGSDRVKKTEPGDAGRSAVPSARSRR